MHRALRVLARFFLPSRANRYKPGFFTARSVGVVLALIVLLELGLLAQSALLPKSDRYITSVLPGMLAAFSNEARVDEALPALHPNARLAQAALLKAEDMASRGYFSHQTPQGSEPWIFLEKVGYEYSYAGENLAVNFSDSKEVTDAWLLSPTHRANLLNADFSEVGFGLATGMYQGREAIFVVQFLASPSGLPGQGSSAPAPMNTIPTVASSPVSVSEAGGLPEVKAYTAFHQPSLLERIFSSPRALSLAITMSLLLGVALLFALAIFIKLRVQHAEVWSNGLLVVSALAGLVLLQGNMFSSNVTLPESAASVSMSLRR